MTPTRRVLAETRNRVSALVRGRVRVARRGRGGADVLEGGASGRRSPAAWEDRVPFEYVINHHTGETLSVEEARLKIGEWQPETQREELAAFLASTNPLDTRSRDFESVETGAVVLSRGVAFLPKPAQGDAKPCQTAQGRTGRVREAATA